MGRTRVGVLSGYPAPTPSFFTAPLAPTQEGTMPLEESTTEYERKLRAFARAHPDATAEDMAVLFPRLRSAPEVMAKFNASGRAHAVAATGAGGAKAPE